MGHTLNQAAKGLPISTEAAYKLTTKAALKGIVISATFNPISGEWAHTWADGAVKYRLTRDTHGFAYLAVKNAIA